MVILMKNNNIQIAHILVTKKIKKSKEERAPRRGGGGYGGERNSERSGRRQGVRNKWSNDNKGGDRNDYGNGVTNRGNAWMLYLLHQDYGWNNTHTYVFHSAWKRDPGAFAFLYNHEYWKLSGKTGGFETGTESSEGSGVGIPSQHRLALSEVISHHQGDASDAIFSSFLTDFSKVLDKIK